MTTQPAMERIAFQPRSQLAAKTIALCAAFTAWAEETSKVRMVDGELPITTDGRINEAIAYANNTFVPGLIKICQSELRLQIKLTVCPDRVIADGAMIPLYQVVVDNKDWTSMTTGEKIFSGLAAPEAVKFDAALFSTLAATLDLDSSKLATKTKEYCVLVFLFPSSFLGTEVFAGITPLSAEEQAAIILHELGHGMTILEHMGELYHRASLATNAVKYISDRADDAVTQQTVAALDTAKTEKSPELVVALDASKTLPIARLHPIIAALLFKYCVVLLIATVLRFFVSAQYGGINAAAHKTSDTTVTRSNGSYMERIADEFVSRHGLGAPLATALARLYGGMGYTRSPLSDAIHNSVMAKTLLYPLGILKHFAATLIYVDEGIYDPDLLRLEHLLSNNMVVFKDDTLSPQLRTYFLQETKSLLATIAEFRDARKRRLQQLFWGTIMGILSRSSIIDGFRTANLSADYDILQLMTNGLVKNKLAYHAARLKQV